MIWRIRQEQLRRIKREDKMELKHNKKKRKMYWAAKTKRAQ